MHVLVVGLGSIAAKHISALRKLWPATKITALRSGTGATDDPSVQSIYDLSQLSSKPDFIIVSNPTNLHYETIKQLLPLKRPLFIEKPLFNSLDGAAELVDQITKAGIVTYVACNLRFHPALRFIKEEILLAGKRINEVSIYCGSYLPDWRPGRDFRESYSADAERGGGAHLDLIHEIDYAFWLFGIPSETLSVRRNQSSLEITAIDFAHYCLVYDSFAAMITLNYFRRAPMRTLEVLFEDRTLTIDLLKCSVTDDSGKSLFKQDFAMSLTYEDQLLYFVRCLENNTRPMNTVEEALKVLQIALK